jgi:hypothetical protein
MFSISNLAKNYPFQLYFSNINLQFVYIFYNYNYYYFILSYDIFDAYFNIIWHNFCVNYFFFYFYFIVFSVDENKRVNAEMKDKLIL